MVKTERIIARYGRIRETNFLDPEEGIKLMIAYANEGVHDGGRD